MNDVILDIANNKPDDDGAYFLGENIVDYDLIIVRFVFSYVKRTVGIIKFLRSKGVRIMDNNLESTGYNIDKIKDSIIFYNNNLPIPRTISTIEENDFINNCTKLGFPVIIKHSGSGKGSGVYKLDNIEDVNNFIADINKKGDSLKKLFDSEFCSICSRSKNTCD